jgi:hypothetical protein
MNSTGFILDEAGFLFEGNKAHVYALYFSPPLTLGLTAICYLLVDSQDCFSEAQ